MEKKLEEILTKLTMLDAIQQTLDETKIVIKNFKEVCAMNTEKLISLEDEVAAQKNTINKLEKSLKKRNLIINGISENDRNLEEVIINVVKMLEIKLNKEEIEEVYRLGKSNSIQSGRPILVSFSSIKIRNEILAKRTKLKGKNIYINEDLPVLERDKRKALQKVLKEKRNQGIDVKMIGDNLYTIENGIRKQVNIDEKNPRDNQSLIDTSSKTKPKPKFILANKRPANQLKKKEACTLNSFLGLTLSTTNNRI